MTSEPIVCTIDPARAAGQEAAVRALLEAAQDAERIGPRQLRLTLSAERGLDISPLAREKRCCRFFDFSLTPTTEGTVILDTRIPAHADPEILDWWARAAAGATGPGA